MTAIEMIKRERKRKSKERWDGFCVTATALSLFLVALAFKLNAPLLPFCTVTLGASLCTVSFVVMQVEKICAAIKGE